MIIDNMSPRQQAMRVSEKSFVNRLASVYRFLGVS